MSTTKVRLWFIRETEKAYQYTKLPPDRQRNPDDLIWIPKSQVEHRSKQPNGLHELTLPNWLVDAKNLLIVLSLILVMGCATHKPKPPSLPLRMEGPIMFNAAGFVQEPRTVVIPWQYPSVIKTNYWWDLQETTNFITWKTVMSNTGPADITVYTTNKYRFYRMRGHQ